MARTGYGMTKEEAITYINSCLEQNINQVYIMNIHDEMLISNWNSVVNNDDIVWFLGDFAFAKHIGTDRVKEIGRKLKGHKKMVYGNHDREKPEFYYSCGFEEVCVRPTLLKGWFLLSHAPSMYMNKYPLFFYVYGHVHSHEGFYTKTENSRCVCVERTDFKPIQIHEYDNYIENDIDNPAATKRK